MNKTADVSTIAHTEIKLNKLTLKEKLNTAVDTAKPPNASAAPSPWIRPTNAVSTTPSTGSSKSEATAGSASAKIAPSNDLSSSSPASSSSLFVSRASVSSDDAFVRVVARRVVARVCDRERGYSVSRVDADEPRMLRCFKRAGLLDGAWHSSWAPVSAHRLPPGPDGAASHLATGTRRAHRPRPRHSRDPGVTRHAVGGARDTAAHRMPADTERRATQ